MFNYLTNFISNSTDVFENQNGLLFFKTKLKKKNYKLNSDISIYHKYVDLIYYTKKSRINKNIDYTMKYHIFTEEYKELNKNYYFPPINVKLLEKFPGKYSTQDQILYYFEYFLNQEILIQISVSNTINTDLDTYIYISSKNIPVFKMPKQYRQLSYSNIKEHFMDLLDELKFPKSLQKRYKQYAVTYLDTIIVEFFILKKFYIYCNKRYVKILNKFQNIEKNKKWFFNLLQTEEIFFKIEMKKLIILQKKRYFEILSHQKEKDYNIKKDLEFYLYHDKIKKKIFILENITKFITIYDFDFFNSIELRSFLTKPTNIVEKDKLYLENKLFEKLCNEAEEKRKEKSRKKRYVKKYSQYLSQFELDEYDNLTLENYKELISLKMEKKSFVDIYTDEYNLYY